MIRDGMQFSIGDLTQVEDLHRATNDAFSARHARRRIECDWFTSQGVPFDVDSHLAVLIADIAVDAFSLLRGDLEPAPATPEIHPERQRAPHPTPDTLTEERIDSDGNRSGEKRPDSEVVPTEKRIATDVGEHCCDRGKWNKDKPKSLQASRPFSFGTAMAIGIADRLREGSAGTDVRAIDLPPPNRDQGDDNKRQDKCPDDANHRNRPPPIWIARLSRFELKGRHVERPRI